MHRVRYGSHPSNPSGGKAQLVLAYQELSNELHSSQLKVIGNYTLGRVIGEGSFGTVRLGIHRLTGSRVAIKHIPKSASPPLLTREIHHHRRLHHPNVVQLYEVIATEHSIWLITELCPGGELFDYLVEKTRFTEFEARRLFGQICLGLGYVHGQGVVHRDLKLENVLLDERCNPKLADFGFGREFEPRKLLDTFCGTTGYAAPEMLAGKKYLGQEVDIWSLGIILHALLTGSLPFDDDDEDVMKSMILIGQFEVPNFLSHEACNLIQSILQLDPKARPSIEKILSHPWFTTPPLQHSFADTEPISRPSPILEESQQLSKSPPASLSSFEHPHRASTPSDSQVIISDQINQSNPSVNDSDVSELSGKESTLSVDSRRSNTSSPATSEGFSVQLSAMPNLDPTSSNSSLDRCAETSNASTLLLKHSNSSHSTIKKSQSSLNLLPHHPLQYLPTHAEDEGGLRHPDYNILSPAETCTNHEPKRDVSPQSSHSFYPTTKAGATKPHPLALYCSLPSSVAHPQIRTPSRTKRRSIGSVMSERIGPFDDSASDLATPTANQARLSTSSLMTVVIDYLSALKATTQAPLLSPDDLAFLNSLGPLGFDTGQIIHSVQSYACDSSGALWWLLKKKLEKRDTGRDELERNPTSASTGKTPITSDSLELQSRESSYMSHPASNNVASSGVFAPVETSATLYPTMSITPPHTLPAPPASVIKASAPVSKRSSSPNRIKLAITNTQKMEPLLNLIRVEKELGKDSLDVSEHRSNLNPKFDAISSKNSSNLNVLPHHLNDDGYSSTSSLKLETPSSSDKEASHVPVDPVASGKKSISDLRKRSHSVSMLQRATNALATKKTPDDKYLKSRSREASSTNDSDEKHGHEKISKRDLKAREKDSKIEEHSKPSSSLAISGLFSRKALLLPPLSHLPVALMSHQPSVGSDKACHKPKELDLPTDNRATVSMPSSPSPTKELDLMSTNDGDLALNVVENDRSRTSTPGSVSFSSSSIGLTALSFTSPDPFSTPKHHLYAVNPILSAPSSKADEPRRLREVSPAVCSLTEVTDHPKSSPPEVETVKSSRSKGAKNNLFSNFKHWFNEDRRKRKQTMPVIANYNTVKSPTSRLDSRSSCQNMDVVSPMVTSHLGSELHVRKFHGDPQVARSASGSAGIHRRTSKGSRRSSAQSSRRVSLDLHHINMSASKRRSGSSRASFGSVTGSRTPNSERGSHQALNPDGLGRIRGPEAHARRTSLSSSGSRRSSALQRLSPGHLTIKNPAFLRPSSSAGTTVRRVTAPAGSASTSNRHRPLRKASSLTSSVRTSMSSDDGSKSMSRRASSGTDDHRLHSPMNVHDVDETIEEEDDGEEQDGDNKSITTDPESGLNADDARRSAFQKLSGTAGPKDSTRANFNVEGAPTTHGTGGGCTRTIFMAHKPHSVFGTPTQAFFARSTQSPVATKFSTIPINGNGAGLSYVNLMKSIADGPTSRKVIQPKIRDVFANKAKEDGEWVDLDDEDDGCAKYEGGIGQGVTSRNGQPISERTTSSTDGKNSMNFAKIDSKLPPKEPHKKSGPLVSTQSVSYGSTMGSGAPTLGSPTVPNSLMGASIGGSSAPGLIGNWRGGNPRVTSNFKSVAIEEEEEEE